MQRALITNLGRHWRHGHSTPLLHLLSDPSVQCSHLASDDQSETDCSLGPSSSHGGHGAGDWKSSRASLSASVNCDEATPFGVRHASFWPWRSRGSAESSGQLPQTSEDEDLMASAEFFPLPETSFEAVTAIDQACMAIEIASISAAKSDAWFMASWFIHGIQSVHDATGLPWSEYNKQVAKNGDPVKVGFNGCQPG
eukprot:gene3988-14067_t